LGADGTYVQPPLEGAGPARVGTHAWLMELRATASELNDARERGRA